MIVWRKRRSNRKMSLKREKRCTKSCIWRAGKQERRRTIRICSHLVAANTPFVFCQCAACFQGALKTDVLKQHAHLLRLRATLLLELFNLLLTVCVSIRFVLRKTLSQFSHVTKFLNFLLLLHQRCEKQKQSVNSFARQTNYWFLNVAEHSLY